MIPKGVLKSAIITVHLKRSTRHSLFIDYHNRSTAAVLYVKDNWTSEKRISLTLGDLN